MKKILVVVAHPDDEVLGCGATLLKHAKAGDAIHILILAEGMTSRDDVRDPIYRKKELERLHSASQRVAEYLQAKSLEIGDFPDNRLDGVEILDVVKKVEKEIKKYSPEIVYTHHGGDLNIDHRIVNQAVVTACRPIPEQSVEMLLFFETPSSTDYQIGMKDFQFTPNWIVDIKETFSGKLEMLRFYQEEMRPWPHSRSYEAIEVLAKYRGYTNGMKYAEAFQLGRKILK